MREEEVFRITCQFLVEQGSQNAQPASTATVPSRITLLGVRCNLTPRSWFLTIPKLMGAKVEILSVTSSATTILRLT